MLYYVCKINKGAKQKWQTKKNRLKAVEALILEAKKEGIIPPAKLQEYEAILDDLKKLKELAKEL